MTSGMPKILQLLTLSHIPRYCNYSITMALIKAVSENNSIDALRGVRAGPTMEPGKHRKIPQLAILCPNKMLWSVGKKSPKGFKRAKVVGDSAMSCSDLMHSPPICMVKHPVKLSTTMRAF